MPFMNLKGIFLYFKSLNSSSKGSPFDFENSERITIFAVDQENDFSRSKQNFQNLVGPCDLLGLPLKKPNHYKV